MISDTEPEDGSGTAIDCTMRVGDGMMVATLTHPVGYVAELRLPLAALASDEEGELELFIDHMESLFGELLDQSIAAAEAEVDRLKAQVGEDGE